jgi:hypothetical protein
MMHQGEARRQLTPTLLYRRLFSKNLPFTPRCRRSVDMVFYIVMHGTGYAGGRQVQWPLIAWPVSGQPELPFAGRRMIHTNRACRAGLLAVRYTITAQFDICLLLPAAAHGCSTSSVSPDHPSSQPAGPWSRRKAGRFYTHSSLCSAASACPEPYIHRRRCRRRTAGKEIIPAWLNLAFYILLLLCRANSANAVFSEKNPCPPTIMQYSRTFEHNNIHFG